MIRRDSCCCATSVASRRTLRSRSVSSSSSSKNCSFSSGAARQSSTTSRSPTRAVSSRRPKVRPGPQRALAERYELGRRMDELARSDRPTTRRALTPSKLSAAWFKYAIASASSSTTSAVVSPCRMLLGSGARRALRAAPGGSNGGDRPVGRGRPRRSAVRVLDAGLLHDEGRTAGSARFPPPWYPAPTACSVCVPRNTSGTVIAELVAFKLRR